MLLPIQVRKSVNGRRDPRQVLVTVLRDALERLASHYSYWKSVELPGHFLWKWMIAEDWTFAEFAMSNEMRNFYSQYFFKSQSIHLISLVCTKILKMTGRSCVIF